MQKLQLGTIYALKNENFTIKESKMEEIIKTFKNLQPSETTELYWYRNLSFKSTNAQFKRLKKMLIKFSEKKFIELDVFSGQIVFKLTNNGYSFFQNKITLKN